MKQKTIMFFAACCCWLLLYQPGQSHPGRTDANGGHYDRKTGKYHYHNNGGQGSGNSSSTIKAPANPYTPPVTRPGTYREHDSGGGVPTQVEGRPTVITEEIYRRINEYFRAANENVGALDCNVKIYSRDVSESLKDKVRRRDGYRCVICGGNYKLEVDHKRSLQNGGTNNIENLALLCDTCHTIKTKHDNSLRRKREALCGKKR